MLVLSFPESDYIKIVILNVKLVVVTPLFFESGRLGRLALNTNLLSFFLFKCFPLASVPARTGCMVNGSMVFS